MNPQNQNQDQQQYQAGREPAPAPTPAEHSGPDSRPPYQPVVMHHARPSVWKKVLLVAALTILVVLVTAAAMIGRKESKEPDNRQAATSTQQTNDTAKEDSKQNTATPPAGWQTLDTTLGFSVKAPAGWTASFAVDATINNLQTNSVALGAAEMETEAPALSASKQTLAGQPGQQAFEAAVTQLDADAQATLEQLGIDRNSIRVSSKHVTLGGKQWLQVDTSYPGQLTRTLYLWNADHAIALTLLTEGDAALKAGSDKYLLPMASSVTIP